MIPLAERKPVVDKILNAQYLKNRRNSIPYKTVEIPKKIREDPRFEMFSLRVYCVAKVY